MVLVGNIMHKDGPRKKTLTVQLLLKQPINLCLIYNPPNSESSYHQKLLVYISDIMQSAVEVILLGDFNAPDINWSTLSASSNFSSNLCGLIFQFNYVQQLNHPTHIHGNILDLIITSSADTISDINLTQEFDQVIKSDHHLISFKLHQTYSTPITSRDPVYIFDYHKGDYEGLNDFLNNIDFSTCYQSNNVEFIWSFIKSTLAVQYYERIYSTYQTKCCLPT